MDHKISDKKILYKDIGLTLILILFYFNSIISLAYIDDNALFKYLSLFVVGLFILLNIKVILKKKYLFLNLMILIFVGLIVLFSFFNRNQISGRNTFYASIIFALKIVLSFFMLEYLVEKEKFYLFIRVFYWLTLNFVIFTDVLVFAIGSRDGNYLVGTKFQVSYLHLELIIFFLLKIKKNFNFEYFNVNILKLLVQVFWSIFIIIRVDCNTALVGLFFLFLFCGLTKRHYRFWLNPLVFVVSVLLSFAVVFAIEYILQNSTIQYFIVNVLKTDLTLTMRTSIFNKFPIIMKGHLLMGYGYGSEYEITMKYVGAADIQNGLASWILQNGLIVTAILLVIMFYVFKVARLNCNRVRQLSAAILYVFVFMATVEITMDITFIFWIAMVYAGAFLKKNNYVKFSYSSKLCNVSYSNYKENQIVK